jgi:hypothetical protein
MWDTNPWAKWMLSYVTRDGRPVLTETGLWYLRTKHPEAIETDRDEACWVHLDRIYRVAPSADRAFYWLTPDPGHVRAAASGQAGS